MHVKKLRPAVAINCSAAAASVQSSTPEGRSRRADRRATHATGARASRHRRARRRGTPTGSAACVARPALGARLVGRPLYCTLAEEEEHSSCWCTCWGVNSVSGGFKVQQRGARACVRGVPASTCRIHRGQNQNGYAISVRSGSGDALCCCVEKINQSDRFLRK